MNDPRQPLSVTLEPGEHVVLRRNGRSRLLPGKKQDISQATYEVYTAQGARLTHQGSLQIDTPLTIEAAAGKKLHTTVDMTHYATPEARDMPRLRLLTPATVESGSFILDRASTHDADIAGVLPARTALTANGQQQRRSPEDAQLLRLNDGRAVVIEPGHGGVTVNDTRRKRPFYISADSPLAENQAGLSQATRATPAPAAPAKPKKQPQPQPLDEPQAAKLRGQAEQAVRIVDNLRHKGALIYDNAGGKEPSSDIGRAFKQLRSTGQALSNGRVDAPSAAAFHSALDGVVRAAEKMKSIDQVQIGASIKYMFEQMQDELRQSDGKDKQGALTPPPGITPEQLVAAVHPSAAGLAQSSDFNRLETPRQQGKSAPSGRTRT